MNELLYEKLRPKRFEHLILSPRIKEMLGNGEIAQNVLLYGPPGTGKTSAAKVLALKAMGHADFYINCSDETGVDVIRDKINNLCSTMSVMEGEIVTKVVILDELDGVSDQFFKALRGTMEKFTNCRFVATTNFINKVPEAIQSRFVCVNFGFATTEEEESCRKEWSERLQMVMEKVGISATTEAMSEFVDRNFPDMRKALNKVQSFQVRGITTLTAESVRQMSWSFEELYKIIVGKPDPIETYKYVVGEVGSRVDDAMDALGNEFVEWLRDTHPEKVKYLPRIIIAVADHQAKRNLVIDPVVAMNSLVFTIQRDIAQ